MKAFHLASLMFIEPPNTACIDLPCPIFMILSDWYDSPRFHLCLRQGAGRQFSWLKVGSGKAALSRPAHLAPYWDAARRVPRKEYTRRAASRWYNKFWKSKSAVEMTALLFYSPFMPLQYSHPNTHPESYSGVSHLLPLGAGRLCVPK